MVNRLFYSGLAIVLILITAYIYEKKRSGIINVCEKITEFCNTSENSDEVADEI
jgi:hypothetical protein